jgi:ubiquinone/menaquinone biosynthesis C-methylase UbiE
LYFYQDGLTEERTQKEVDLLVRELKLGKPMTILDLACGHGRHANRLAALGHNVTGVDITKGFLKIAKRDAKAKGVRVKYIHHDMRKIKFKNEFDRVILMYTAFGYFGNKENFLVLKNVSRALKPNGMFSLDILNVDSLQKRFLPFIVSEKGKDLMIDRNTYDKTTGRFYNKRIVIRNGIRKDKPFFIRLYNRKEMSCLLKKAGFKSSRFFGDWDSKPLTSDSRRMMVIAQKGK